MLNLNCTLYMYTYTYVHFNQVDFIYYSCVMHMRNYSIFNQVAISYVVAVHYYAHEELHINLNLAMHLYVIKSITTQHARIYLVWCYSKENQKKQI